MRNSSNYYGYNLESMQESYKKAIGVTSLPD